MQSYRRVYQNARNAAFSVQPMPPTLRTLPVSAKTMAQASRHAPVVDDRPPGADARISDGRNEGEDGEAEGCRVRTVRLRLGNGCGVASIDSKCLAGCGMGHAAEGTSSVGAGCLPIVSA